MLLYVSWDEESYPTITVSREKDDLHPYGLDLPETEIVSIEQALAAYEQAQTKLQELKARLLTTVARVPRK